MSERHHLPTKDWQHPDGKPAESKAARSSIPLLHGLDAPVGRTKRAAAQCTRRHGKAVVTISATKFTQWHLGQWKNTACVCQPCFQQF